MKSFKELLAKIKKADEMFNLINDGDKIVIGISGGKDSITLFEALMTYKKYAKKDFELIPVILNLGFERFDATAYIKHFADRGYELFVSDASNVAKILHTQQELQHLPKLPCSICSKMKKAAINKVATNLGANKVAFAHHIDDALETLFMNMISGGRFATFKPQMYLQRAQMHFIRPLILVDEELIIRVQQELNLPLLEYTCPNNKKTRREDIKQLLNGMYQTYDSAKKNFRLMLVNDKEFDLWFNDFGYQLRPGVVIKKANSLNQFNDALYIRLKVFHEEQNISVDDEFDSEESNFVTYVVYVDGNRAATIRYVVDEVKRTVTIGRLAVLKAYRHTKIATQMIKYLESLLITKYRPLTFHIGGQEYLKSFYLNLGYSITDDPYLDAGITHFHFTKNVK